MVKGQSSGDREGGGQDGQVGSIKKAADGRQAGRSLMERKVQAQERIVAEHLDRLKKATFVVLKNYANIPARKKIMSSTSKARREASEISL